jgi:glycosyltransferase involved in cell wall biosynthesis
LAGHVVRIAVFHNLPSGGALRLLSQSARLLAERGHELALFTFSSAEREFAPWPVDGELLVWPLDLHGRGLLARYGAATTVVADRIKAWKPDVVWVEKCRLFGHPPMLNALAARGLRTILHTHEPRRSGANERLAPHTVHGVPVPDFPSGGSGPLYPVGPSANGLGALIRRALQFPQRLRIRADDRRAIGAAGTVLTSSRFTQLWLERCYGVKAALLAPGIDTHFLSPDPTVRREQRAVTVGRLGPMKGFDFLVQVLGRMAAAERPAWDIVCDDVNPTYRDWFDRTANALGVTYQLHHRVSDEGLRELYRRSRAALCAATNEPFGLVPPEAMACGTPVVARYSGGFAETVSHRQTGYLLTEDPLEWGDKIRGLMRDDGLVTRMGAVGRQRVEKHWGIDGWVDRRRRHRTRRLIRAAATFT